MIFSDLEAMDCYPFVSNGKHQYIDILLSSPPICSVYAEMQRRLVKIKKGHYPSRQNGEGY